MVTITAADVTAFSASAKMQPPSAQSQAFDAACSVWLGRRIDTIPLGLHRLLSDLRLPDSLLIDGRTKAALFDSLDLNGFWPGPQDWPNFYHITISIANAPACLAVSAHRFRHSSQHA